MEGLINGIQQLLRIGLTRPIVFPICQDLELERTPELDDFYFTESRVYSLSQLNDHCPQALAHCARDVDLPRSMFLSEDHRNQHSNSLVRVTDHVFRKTPTPAAVPLQASFWLTLPRQWNLYREPPQKLDVLVSTKSGSTIHSGHSSSPVYNSSSDTPSLVLPVWMVLGISYFISSHPKELTLFGTVPLEGQRMEVNCIVFCLLSTDEPIPFTVYFYSSNEQCVALLKDMIDDLKTSRLHLLVWTWNVSRTFEDRSVYSEDLAGLLIGAQMAMQRPPEPACAFILASLSQLILRLRDTMFLHGARTLIDREVVADRATQTSQLLLSSLVTQLIFGRRNALLISCA